MKPRKLLSKDKVAPTVCLLIIISGIVTLCLWPSFVNNIIETEFTLTPSSKTFQIWEKTPLPLTLDFYLFNWTNPDDLMNSSTKPHFIQMGPYKFKETYQKVDIVWNDNNTVSFRQLKNWFFDAENSNGSLTDNVTTLNAVAVSASFAARNLNYIMKRGLSMTLSALVKDLHITRTAGELIFDGYEDPIVTLSQTMPALHGMKMPNWDRFAWFYGRNNSKDLNGVLNMATGKGKLPMGELTGWEYETETSYYKGSCAEIKGSAGEFFPPFATKEKLAMFSPEMCRKIEFDYTEEVEIYGIKGYKYKGGSRMADNGTIYPENKCFCNGECIPSGVMNVSSCRYGSPGFISFPHFYGADPFYLNQVDGLMPIEEKHQFHIIIEPRTGIPLDVAARFQINILLQRIDDISYVQDVPKTFFPMVWFEQRATITEELADGLETLLSLPVVGATVAITVIVIGIIMFLTVVSMYMVKHFEKLRQRQKTMDLTREEMPLNESAQAKIKINSNHC